MASIRNFETTVGRRDSYEVVLIQTPLTAGGNKPDVGWVTKITVLYSSNREILHPLVIEIARTTTLVRHTRRGVRRRLKGHPITTDLLVLGGPHTTSTTITRWDDKRSITSSTLTGLSVERTDLCALILGCIETREGRPLVDWLAENANEIVPFLSEPGWLPQSVEELEAVMWQRKEEASEMYDEDLDEDYTDDEEGDRWR
ncbi:hypothetical protein [Frigoriglobus tundricola]|uniref:Uncharacterized protein n=1 Tax=Frigoriglobus tundricola TaxID=2774151 RepID=A0A6M5YU68_9BACT|nr:hypothetical protein [Frigoriglobus tundricola]QJW97615.1 hypothetical protein FTUN_5190 [Frigoriglobus tundricola]